MAITPESVFTILSDLALPVTMQDLQNPTEKFMINIMTHILKRLSIDVDAVEKPTMDQLEALRVSGLENAPILKIMNLRQVISHFSREIFIKDFTISDLTNPGPKRTRKILKIFGNFLLYARRAKEEMQPDIDEVLARGQRITELRQKTQELQEKMNIKAFGISKKKTTSDNLDREIEKITKEIQEGKENMEEKEMLVKAIKERHQNIFEDVENKRQEIKKITDITAKLKEKIVKDPESYKARLLELKEQIQNKEEKRSALQDALKSKKPTIAMLENCLAAVVKARNKLPEIIELNKEILEAKQKAETLIQQINEITSTLQADDNDSYDKDEEEIFADEVNKCKISCEEHLSKYRATINELMNEKKFIEKSYADKQAEEVEMYVKRDSLRRKVMEKEAEVAKFLKDCQNLINKEIKEVVEHHEEAHDAVSFPQFREKQ
ncbi:probable kinetochore protein NUF2 [Chelonus insularis]|uniref:probable kinetochore protein NUF2 n=1 Tax=Chelonus insularis TaxID=460826 RepID=UPI001589D96D|nr:probable kinetochore protein NUF2 [Chelonus insularis]XP_034939995.1 probable kinetochore protein NUF2 [Chelonus insularis]